MTKPTVSGYPRSFGGSFLNPKGGIPSIVFDRELQCEFQAQPFAQRIGSLAVSLTDPVKPLPLINPLDDTPIPVEAFIAKLQAQGGAVHEDLYILHYSIYQQVEDEAIAAASVVVEPEI